MDFRQNGMSGALRVQRPAPKVPGARSIRVTRLARRGAAPHAARLDLNRGLIVVASLAALLGVILAGGYGVHSQIAAANDRTVRQYWQLAAATREELREGAVLFVPIGGNVCRRRYIDNVTWTLRDGGEVECDREVSWNATVPELQPYQVGMRMDAVRNTFRAKGSAILE